MRQKLILRLIALTSLAFAASSWAQTSIETVLHSFNGTDGNGPAGSLMQGSDGDFYGTTYVGGNFGATCNSGQCGTVFRITRAGTFTTLYAFSGPDGFGPYSGLVEGSDGNFYGTTSQGGTSSNCNNGCGTVFKLTPGGVLTTLYSFGYADGFFPTGTLVQGSDGNFYGTTNGGGTNGRGVVFKITPSGTLTTLISLDLTDGNPFAGLVQGRDGNFYGTSNGGSHGTIFKMTPSGTLTTLHSFNGSDGSDLMGGLVEGSNGNFYGTTLSGDGPTSCGGIGECGTVFEMTPTGTLTTLHLFSGPDGSFPYAGLAKGIDGNLYGNTHNVGTTTCSSAPPGCGTVFKISASGTFASLYSFQLPPDGEIPYGGMVQGTDGYLYGTTSGGGAFGTTVNTGDGTVFRIAVVVPGPIAFLGAAPGNGQVTLRWSPSVGAASYTIYQGTAPGEETAVASGVTGSKYVATGLSNGTPYYFYVVGVNAAGDGPKSKEVTATPE